jgi:uncharacterized membrane protein YphA (DoxX/SURF4 family)
MSVATSEEATTVPVRTPFHLWLVGVVSLLWNAVGALDYFMTQTRNEGYMASFSPEQLEYFYGFPVWATSAWALAVWSAVLGSVLLLARRALAVAVFFVSFVAMVVSTLHTSLSGGWGLMGGVGPVVFSGAIFIIGLLLWRYAAAMRRRGVLR